MVTDAEPHPIEVSNLVKRYGALGGVGGVDLAVRKGSITGLIGVNGAGKSTTLRSIMGLTEPDSGQVRLFGIPASHGTRLRIGFLPEERGLPPRDRARNVIAFHGRMRGMARKAAFAAADELLERVNLGQRRASRIEDLSKGNAQRVQILCTLVHRPDLLILDEPLSGLDPVAQSDVLALFAEFRSRGGSILLSTHSMAAVENLCDHVVILANGRTVFEGGIAAAADLAPHGALVVTSDPAALAAVAARLGGTASPISGGMGDSGRWQVLLPATVPHPALLRALSERSVPIMAFEPIRKNLEGAFWALSKPCDQSRAA